MKVKNENHNIIFQVENINTCVLLMHDKYTYKKIKINYFILILVFY